ncbi:MAG: hypothetical protein JWO13_3627 [Acidobacteriales bacterium]|nr:hypothetical protein [Terriglobales bacterium]
MVRRFHSFALVVGLLSAAVPGWGSQSPEKEAANPTEYRQARQLPEGGSELPLLFVIGMGILSGGVISAMRTRPNPVKSNMN